MSGLSEKVLQIIFAVLQYSAFPNDGMAGETSASVSIGGLVLGHAAQARVEAHHETDVGEGAAQSDRREVRRVASVAADLVAQSLVVVGKGDDAQFLF